MSKDTLLVNQKHRKEKSRKLVMYFLLLYLLMASKKKGTFSFYVQSSSALMDAKSQMC